MVENSIPDTMALYALRASLTYLFLRHRHTLVSMSTLISTKNSNISNAHVFGEKQIYVYIFDFYPTNVIRKGVYACSRDCFIQPSGLRSTRSDHNYIESLNMYEYLHCTVNKLLSYSCKSSVIVLIVLLEQ